MSTQNKGPEKPGSTGEVLDYRDGSTLSVGPIGATSVRVINSSTEDANRAAGGGTIHGGASSKESTAGGYSISGNLQDDVLLDKAPNNRGDLTGDTITDEKANGDTQPEVT